MREPANQPLGWYPPIPTTDERLGCAYCDWSCPRWYQNQTGPKAPPPGRDGTTRLAAHVEAEHYHEHRKAKRAARDRRRYAERKAVREAARQPDEPTAPAAGARVVE